MASSYPGSLDNFSTSHVDDVDEIIHASTINDNADAINKIEAELGTNPKGSAADVKTRIANTETVANAAIPGSTVTTKGDLIAATGSAAITRLGVGSDTQVLTADSTQPTGMKWSAPAGGGDTLHTVSASGASQTINFATADVWDITLTANCTLTLSGFTTGNPDYLTLVLRQDGTGSRTVTWPTITWIGTGIAPILQTAAGGVDSVVLFSFDGGTNVYGIAQTSTSGLRSGTSFPGSPSDGDLFYRTDSRLLYEWDNTVGHWLSVNRWHVTFDLGDISPDNTTTAGGARRLPLFEDIYIERWITTTFVATTNNGSNYWALTLNKHTATAAVSVSTFSTNLDTVNNYVPHNVSVGVVMDHTTYCALSVDTAKNGTPGGIRMPSQLVVRSVG